MPTEYNKVRVTSFAIINNNGKTLVSPGYDKVKDSHFYRLIGGGIEFGETSLEALKRELMEELGTELTDCKLLDVNENIFTYNGGNGHEVCFIYEASFTDKSNYKKISFPVIDAPEWTAVWVDINKENINKIKPEVAAKFFQKNN
jgi:8-oxo-dGTP pyrophosphatase MutT (NUDIX family)